MKQLHVLILAAGVFAGSTLWAHDHGQPAPNGGQLRQAGPYDFELVVDRVGQDEKEKPVIVYLTVHDGAKVPTAGASGSATILVGKLKTTTVLKPDGDNRMKGVAKYSAAADMKVIVSITLDGKSAEQARFTPMAKSGQ
ncbi:MAG: hypothetical protein D4S02_16270 [Rhodocyclaceae bacterium]|nr:MAG: hypothetical protein D4S02_16270 [Rhodocyclaceae bacterium]